MSTERTRDMVAPGVASCGRKPLSGPRSGVSRWLTHRSPPVRDPLTACRVIHRRASTVASRHRVMRPSGHAAIPHPCRRSRDPQCLRCPGLRPRSLRGGPRDPGGWSRSVASRGAKARGLHLLEVRRDGGAIHRRLRAATAPRGIETCLRTASVRLGSPGSCSARSRWSAPTASIVPSRGPAPTRSTRTTLR